MSLIKYYTGTMYAGKSTRLITELMIYSEQKVLVTPSIKNRGFASRDIHTPAESVVVYHDMREYINNIGNLDANHVLAIDEVQFFDRYALNLLLLSRMIQNKSTLLAGLDRDQHGNEFESHKFLREIKVKYERFLTVCNFCGCDDASISVRRWITDDRATDEYAPLCRACFDKFHGYNDMSSTHVIDKEK